MINDVRVCGGLASVRILFILLCVFDDFGERHSSLILYGFVNVLWKCIWPLLADVKFSCVGLFYIMFFMISGSWKGQTEAYSVFDGCFINVSRPLMSEFVEGCQCSQIVYFMKCC